MFTPGSKFNELMLFQPDTKEGFQALQSRETVFKIQNKHSLESALVSSDDLCAALDHVGERYPDNIVETLQTEIFLRFNDYNVIMVPNLHHETPAQSCTALEINNEENLNKKVERLEKMVDRLLTIQEKAAANQDRILATLEKLIAQGQVKHH